MVGLVFADDGVMLTYILRLTVDGSRSSRRAMARVEAILTPVDDQNAFGLVEVASCSLAGWFTGERYQSALGFSLRPVARMCSLRHTLPVRLDTPTARVACVKFSPAFSDATYCSRLVAHLILPEIDQVLQ